MKKMCVCVCILVLFPGMCVVPVLALEQENSNLFQNELTYIRYRLNRLNRNACPIWDAERIEGFLKHDADTTTFTLEHDEIDRIDAYVEIGDLNFTLGDVDNVPHNSADAVEVFETFWNPASPTERTICVNIQDMYDNSQVGNKSNDISSYNLPETSWNIDDIALVLDYDNIHEDRTGDEQYLRGEHLMRGKMNMPLGESGFSLGAYLAMYTADDRSVYEQGIDNSTSQRIVPIPILEIPEEAGGIAQTTFVGSPSNQSKPMTTSAPVLQGINPRRAVAGAVNFSGVVRRFDVFTEVGLVGTGEQTVDTVAEDMRVANFYALGGAQYNVGRVTLGVEAGFENGDEPIDEFTDNFSGFENDFEFDRLLEDDIPGDAFHNKLYAKLSAHMNPTEKIRIEGAFSCVKPVEDGGKMGPYGIEVNGTFYYSLADYITCLIKAGVTSSEDDSIEDSQYKVINKLEFRF
jgi:hypothetical protein